jgi:nucleotide-binding universal stress UspA family protein
MAYKTIFTNWDGRPESASTLDAAIELARTHDGHLNIACIGVDMTPSGFYASELGPEALSYLSTVVKEQAEALAEEARAKADAAGIQAAVHPMTARFYELTGLIGREGRFHDISVLPAPYDREDDGIAEAVLEGALFQTLAPVLVHPKISGEIGKRVMIAWNGDIEAMRAIRAALPILVEAEMVEITMVDPQRHPADRADPGVGLLEMLTRHGAPAELAAVAQTTHRVSDTLMRRATDIGADLIVMGAYGHSRFRERLIGGATRDILEDCKLPILMTH